MDVAHSARASPSPTRQRPAGHGLATPTPSNRAAAMAINSYRREIEARSRKRPSTAVIDLTGDSDEDDTCNDIPSRPPKRVKPSSSASTTTTTPTGTTTKVQVASFGTENQHQKCARSPSASDTIYPATEQPPHDDNENTRMSRFRPRPTKTFHTIHDRALTQRMYVLSRERSNSASTSNPLPIPQETLALAGTTGNIYTVVIGWPFCTCDCPHARKGNQCKHVIYVLARVLRAPLEYQWQASLTPAELRWIFEKAPPLPEEVAEGSSRDGGSGAAGDGLRKAVEGECPICCEDFDVGGVGDAETIVYCKASCGNNVHKECFDRWAASKVSEAKVTCPLCRAPWQGVERSLEKCSLKDLARSARLGDEGYFNLADELNMSESRDTSTYNDYFMRRHYGRSWWEDYDY